MQLKPSLQKILGMLIILFSAITLASEATYTEAKPNIAVTAKEPQFTIQLKSNPTTGYSWFLREYNSELIVPLKHHFQAGNAKLIGAPGYELWTFKVKPTAFVVPQQMVLRFVYARPWEESNSSSQVVFRVTTLQK